MELQPWQDCPRCPRCGKQGGAPRRTGRRGLLAFLRRANLQCGMCGAWWRGDRAQLEKAEAAQAAWEQLPGRLG